MDNIRKVDCALLPPCEKVLRQKTKRAQYQAIIWGNAETMQTDRDLDPLIYGWRKDSDGLLTPDWFPGSDVPANIFQDISETTNSDEESSEWSDDSDYEY